jgi:hypothetical protein
MKYEDLYRKILNENFWERVTISVNLTMAHRDTSILMFSILLKGLLMCPKESYFKSPNGHVILSSDIKFL